MTRDEILAKWDSLTPRERDVWIAKEIFNARICTRDDVRNFVVIGEFGENDIRPLNGGWKNCGWRQTEKKAWEDIPRYSTDIAAAWEVEEEIDKLYLRVAYCQALQIVVRNNNDYVTMFDYVHASPADRCKAALLAVMEG